MHQFKNAAAFLYLHEFDARVERVVETKEKQKVLLHRKKLGKLKKMKQAEKDLAKKT
jgi:hypothetical protein